MSRTHEYTTEIRWTGNRGTGTSSYRDYDRAHDVSAEHKATVIHGSSDPAFRGDPARWNPEELLVASLAQCHMLWFLHLAAVSKVVVTDYVDRPHGTMLEQDDGAGHFTEVVLRPEVTVADSSMRDRSRELHDQAHAKCYVARSVNFPVLHEPTVHVRNA
jgi:organic hydroperoxide reductase OsmC/OhrA